MPGYGEPDVATETLDETATNGNGSTAPASVLEALRARRAAIAADRHYDLPVTGYGGRLVLRLGPVSAATLSRLRERMERSRAPEREYNLNADTMIAAVREVLVRARPSDPLQPLDADDPVRIDDRLAELLALPAGTARELLLALFGLANNPEWAVIDAMNDYLGWSSQATDEGDEELEGES